MRKFLFAIPFVALAATPALAVDDGVMSTRFGNTEIVSTSLGEAHMYFKPDHTFTGTASALFFHTALKGTWKIGGDTICLNYESPPPGESNPSCAPIAPHAVGETWDSKGRKITLVKGVQ